MSRKTRIFAVSNVQNEEMKRKGVYDEHPELGTPDPYSCSTCEGLVWLSDDGAKSITNLETERKDYVILCPICALVDFLSEWDDVLANGRADAQYTEDTQKLRDQLNDQRDFGDPAMMLSMLVRSMLQHVDLQIKALARSQ